MASRWSAERVRALAPDTAALTAAHRLPAAGWGDTGCTVDLVWGGYAGSASYRVAIDLTGPAYRCSCPSRKFPCKHALALLLRWSDEVVGEADAPDDVASWQAGRRPKTPRGPRDEVAAAKRAGERDARVAAGLAELEVWLRDQVRAGFTSSTGTSHVERVAARMVDAQAPGVAATLRRAATLPASGSGWPARLLAEYAQLHLLVRAHGRLAELPDQLAAVVRTRIGYPVARASVLATPAVSDLWQVLTARDVLDASIPTRRVWLRGANTGHDALLLAFDPLGRFAGSDEANLPVGGLVDADLHFYPGAPPLRAALGARRDDFPGGPPSPALTTVEELLADWAAALAADPWLTEWPVLVRGVPRREEERWYLADESGAALPLRPGGVDIWPLVSISGGAPVVVAGEYGPSGLLPLTCWADDRAVVL